MSSINSIAKSMNGIKTIETSEVIFTDDNSSLISSTGISEHKKWRHCNTNLISDRNIFFKKKPVRVDIS